MDHELNNEKDFYGWGFREKKEEPSFTFFATKTIRVISGGEMKDFDDLKKALEYMARRVEVYSYASINTKCPIIIKEEIWPQIIS